MPDTGLPQSIIPLAQVRACQVSACKMVRPKSGIGLCDHIVSQLKLHLCILFWTFDRLLLEAHDFLSSFGHDKAVVGTIERFFQIVDSKWGQGLKGREDFRRCGFDLNRAVWGSNCHNGVVECCYEITKTSCICQCRAG